MKRGPKGMSPEQQLASGETRPSRQIVHLFPDVASRPDPECIPPPKGMSAAARKLWVIKVDRYRQRGQKVEGEEDGLRQYCEIEAQLNAMWRKRELPPVALINAHRGWCCEFFDTPASKKAKAKDLGGAPGNRFAVNRRPIGAPAAPVAQG